MVGIFIDILMAEELLEEPAGGDTLVFGEDTVLFGTDAPEIVWCMSG